MNVNFSGSIFSGTIVKNGVDPQQPSMLVCLDGVTSGGVSGNGTGCNGVLDGPSCRYVYNKYCNGKNGWWVGCSSLSLVQSAPPYGSFPPNPPPAPPGMKLVENK